MVTVHLWRGGSDAWAAIGGCHPDKWLCHTMADAKASWAQFTFLVSQELLPSTVAAVLIHGIGKSQT